MGVVLPYDEALASYELGPSHPLKPERFTLAVGLMAEYGLISNPGDEPAADRLHIIGVEPITTDEIELIHTHEYVDVVMRASEDPATFVPSHGLGPGDTPAAHGIHRASMLVCASTTTALRSVVEGDARRGFAVAGGLHHAHANRAAGFCVYNDPAVAIAVMRRDHPGLRVAYVDIDAHHGDGVQEAFYETADVLTLSVHESGRYLFPGSGRLNETGHGDGEGYAINVPLPPLADDPCYRLALREVIAPALEAFAPDVVVAQCGADAHHSDPLTQLGLTLSGYEHLAQGIIETADSVCEGRIVCTGGGGYSTYSVVPRAWTIVAAALLGRELPESLPDAWRRHAEEISGEPIPAGLHDDDFEPITGIGESVRAEAAVVIDRVRSASPLLSG